MVVELNRVPVVLLAIAVVGGLAAATVTSRGGFVMGFFFVFWGGVAALIAWVASCNRTSEAETDPALADVCKAEDRPFFDETGVHRFQGDVLDVENHPTAGAQGRI